MKGDPQTLDADIAGAIHIYEQPQPGKGILIVHHEKDQDAALKVMTIAKRGNIKAEYSSFGDSPDSNLKILTDQLSGVSTVMVVAGHVNPEWAKERVKHIVSTAILKSYKIDSTRLYLAPEATAEIQFEGHLSNLVIVTRDLDDLFKNLF